MKKTKKSIAIIGAGASGITAAYSAAKYGCKNIILIEKNSKIGKKILLTGNGRCNLSNINISAKDYIGDNDFLSYCDKNFDTVSFFQNIGLITKTDEQGRIYPYSNTASSVLDALRFSLKNEFTTIKTDFHIEDVNNKDGIFEINGNNELIKADELIVACGGKASNPVLTGTTGYSIVKKFGHSITALYPALAPLITNEPFIKALKGIRAACKADLYINGKHISSEKGEIQFTDNALSGICIFNLSAFAVQNKNNTSVLLDLAPDISQQQLNEFVFNARKIKNDLPAEELLTGLLHKRISQQIVKSCFNKPLTSKCIEIDETSLKKICEKIKHFEFNITGVSPWENAQVTCGGIPCDEVRPNFESVQTSGLFICGEILNICGKCGGYNLDFAWKSGYSAGKNAALKLKE